MNIRASALSTLQEQMNSRRDMLSGDIPESSYGKSSAVDIARSENGELSNYEAKYLKGCLDSGPAGDASIYKYLYQDQFVKDIATDRWHVYVGPYWEPDLMQHSLGVCEQIVTVYNAMYEYFVSTGNYDDKYLNSVSRAISAKADKLNNLTYRQQVREMASHGEDGLAIHGSRWDTHPNYLCVGNTVIDLKTGMPIRSDPTLYLRAHTSISWPPSSGRPENFLNALETIFAFTQHPPDRLKYLSSPEYGLTEAIRLSRYQDAYLDWQSAKESYTEELVGFMQVLLGYSLIGAVYEHILVIFWGHGRNGKTLLMEIVKEVLDDYCCPVEPEFLLSSRHGSHSSSPSPDILQLQGKRFVYASEVNDNAYFDASKVKRLVGGDTLTGRALYSSEYIRFEPTHTLVLLTNAKPQASSEDFALWKRLLLIPFLVSFVDDPDPNDPRQRQVDKQLHSKLQREKSQILAWMIEGARRYYEEGLIVPESIRRSTEEYRSEMDTIAMFVDECCAVEAEAECGSQLLYDSYKKWAERYGHKPFSIKNFSPLMQKRFERSRSSSGYSFSGLRINDEWNIYLLRQDYC